MTPGHFYAPEAIIACLQAAPDSKEVGSGHTGQTSPARKTHVLTAASPLVLPPGPHPAPQPRQERFQPIPSGLYRLAKGCI